MPAKRPSGLRHAAQFSVYANPDANTRKRFPLLLDVQCDLIADLDTRVVVPLVRRTAMAGTVIADLMPILEVDGDAYVMLTPQLAGIARRNLGAWVADLSERRDDIKAALDLLITGF